MKKFKYVGPHPEVEVPALGGIVVTKNSVVEVHDPDVARGLEGQDDVWKHVVQSKPKAKKTAAKKTAAVQETPVEPAVDPVADDSQEADS